MYELLVLLLPVAAASGWYLARRTYRAERRESHVRRVSASYSRSLEYMLQEKVDEALDLLSSASHLDGDSWDLRLAVGNLFRKRGDLERAIATHLLLVESTAHNQFERSRALLELGRDYYGAGLLDRAEEVFESLSSYPNVQKDALQALLKIYQRERDWLKAIRCLNELSKWGRPSTGERLSQFYCELADEAAGRGEFDEAVRLGNTALASDPACVRVLLLLARLHAQFGNWKEVLLAVAQLEHSSPEFLPEILDLAVEAQSRLGGAKSRKADEYLLHLYKEHDCHAAAGLLADRIAAAKSPTAAAEFLEEALRERPSMFLLCKRCELVSADSPSGAPVTPWSLISNTLRACVSDAKARYACSHCGYRASGLHWKCPSCQSWETMIPTQ